VPARGVARSTLARGPTATIRHADRAWRDRVRAWNDCESDHAAHFIHTGEEARMTAYLISLSLAGMARDRGLGGIFVSAEIIRFIARPDRNRGPTDFPTIAFRSATGPDDLTMDHVDTAACEVVWPHSDEA